MRKKKNGKKKLEKEKGKKLGFCLLVGWFEEEERERIKRDFQERRLYSVPSIEVGVLRSAKRSEPCIIHAPYDQKELDHALKKVPIARRGRVGVYIPTETGYLQYQMIVREILKKEIDRPN